MTEMVSTWPVVLELPLGPEDRADDGFLTDDAVERLFAQGRSAYAERCPELDLPSVAVTDVVVRRGGVAASGEVATIGVAVVEVFPGSFTMEAKVRPADGSGVAASASCVVAPPGGVSEGLKRRLIDLAQTARQYH